MSQQNIEFKAIPGQFNIDEAQGIVECFVAGIGNKDSVGDVLVSGAFSKSLQRRKPRVVWGHNWNDPIGKVLEIYEVAPGDRRLPMKMLNAGIGGLYAKVQFNLGSEKGREAFANVAFFGQEQEWSIGYKTLDSIFDPNLQANILKEVELYEVSPVLHGANQLTGTISVKADEVAIAEKGHGHMMMVGMPGPMAGRPTGMGIPVRPRTPNILESGKPTDVGDERRNALEMELAVRAGAPVKVRMAEDNSVIFDRITPDGQTTTYRVAYHFTGKEFMFGKPQKVSVQTVYMPAGEESGSRVVIPSQMPSMPMQVKPQGNAYFGDDEGENGPIMPKSYDNDEKWDFDDELADLANLLSDSVDVKVGRALSAKNMSKLKAILENLQDVIASAEKDVEVKNDYIIPVALENAFETKQLLDPIFDYHRVESHVTEDGIVITTGITQEFIEAIGVAEKALGRTLSGGLGKLGRAARGAVNFDPRAWDGDGDGLVQEGTPYERPAIPGINDRSTGGRVDAAAATRAYQKLNEGKKPTATPLGRAPERKPGTPSAEPIGRASGVSTADDYKLAGLASRSGLASMGRRKFSEEEEDELYDWAFERSKRIPDDKLFNRSVRKGEEYGSGLTKKDFEYFHQQRAIDEAIDAGLHETDTRVAEILAKWTGEQRGKVKEKDIQYIYEMLDRKQNREADAFNRRALEGVADSQGMPRNQKEKEQILDWIASDIRRPNRAGNLANALQRFTDADWKAWKREWLDSPAVDPFPLNGRDRDGNLAPNSYQEQRYVKYLQETGNTRLIEKWRRGELTTKDWQEIKNNFDNSQNGWRNPNSPSYMGITRRERKKLQEEQPGRVPVYGGWDVSTPEEQDNLEDARKNGRVPSSWVQPKRGRTGLASSTSGDEDSTYDEAIGPRGPRRRTGMREDPIGDSVSERVDLEREIDKRTGRRGRAGLASSGPQPRGEDEIRAVREMAKAHPELSEEDLNQMAVIARIGSPEDITPLAKRLKISEREAEDLLDEFGDRRDGRRGRTGLASRSNYSLLNEKEKKAAKQMMKKYPELTEEDLFEIATVAGIGSPEDLGNLAEYLGKSPARTGALLDEFGALLEKERRGLASQAEIVSGPGSVSPANKTTNDNPWIKIPKHKEILDDILSDVTVESMNLETGNPGEVLQGVRRKFLQAVMDGKFDDWRDSGPSYSDTFGDYLKYTLAEAITDAIVATYAADRKNPYRWQADRSRSGSKATPFESAIDEMWDTWSDGLQEDLKRVAQSPAVRDSEIEYAKKRGESIRQEILDSFASGRAWNNQWTERSYAEFWDTVDDMVTNNPEMDLPKFFKEAEAALRKLSREVGEDDPEILDEINKILGSLEEWDPRDIENSYQKIRQTSPYSRVNVAARRAAQRGLASRTGAIKEPIIGTVGPGSMELSSPMYAISSTGMNVPSDRLLREFLSGKTLDELSRDYKIPSVKSVRHAVNTELQRLRRNALNPSGNSAIDVFQYRAAGMSIRDTAKLFGISPLKVIMRDRAIKKELASGITDKDLMYLRTSLSIDQLADALGLDRLDVRKMELQALKRRRDMFGDPASGQKSRNERLFDRFEELNQDGKYDDWDFDRLAEMAGKEFGVSREEAMDIIQNKRKSERRSAAMKEQVRASKEALEAARQREADIEEAADRQFREDRIDRGGLASRSSSLRNVEPENMKNWELLEYYGGAEDAYSNIVSDILKADDNTPLINALVKNRNKIFEKLSGTQRSQAEQETRGMSDDEVRDWMQDMADNDIFLMEEIGRVAIEEAFDGDLELGQDVFDDIYDRVFERAVAKREGDASAYGLGGGVDQEDRRRGLASRLNFDDPEENARFWEEEAKKPTGFGDGSNPGQAARVARRYANWKARGGTKLTDAEWARQDRARYPEDYRSYRDAQTGGRNRPEPVRLFGLSSTLSEANERRDRGLTPGTGDAARGGSKRRGGTGESSAAGSYKPNTSERDKKIIDKLRELGMSEDEINTLTGGTAIRSGLASRINNATPDELDDMVEETLLRDNDMLERFDELDSDSKYEDWDFDRIAEMAGEEFGLEKEEAMERIKQARRRRARSEKTREKMRGRAEARQQQADVEEAADRQFREDRIDRGGLASRANTVDMTLEEYAEMQDMLKAITDKLEAGDYGADEEIDKLKELSEKIEDSRLANDVVPFSEEEINDYLGMLESAKDVGVGTEGLSKKDKENLDSLIDALKNAQKTGSSESGKLGEAGTRLGSPSGQGKRPVRPLKTSNGTINPHKKLDIELEDFEIGELRDELQMLIGSSSNPEPLRALGQKLEKATNGKFSVEKDEYEEIVKEIDRMKRNDGLVTSDILGVLEQAAESEKGKYSSIDVRGGRGLASRGGGKNNGAPSDIPETMQKELINWARQQRGLRLARESVEKFDKDKGQLPASHWKRLRTLYENMGPGSGGGRRGIFGRGKGDDKKPDAKPQRTRGFIIDDDGPGTSPAASTMPDGVMKIDGWRETPRSQLGSQPGAKFQDPKTGKEYYVKQPKSQLHAENESLVTKFYERLGVRAGRVRVGEQNGKPKIVSEWLAGSKRATHRTSGDSPWKRAVQESFVANAWLANWDATANPGNIVEGADGMPYIIDAGGGLLFRARGEAKGSRFGAVVGEMESLRDPSLNPLGHDYFKDIPPEEIARQVKAIGAISDKEIRQMVEGTITDKAKAKEISDTLIARRDYLVKNWSTGKNSASGRRGRTGLASSSDGYEGRSKRPGVAPATRPADFEVRGGDDGEGPGKGSTMGTKPEKDWTGDSFDDVKPQNWDNLTIDEKWDWMMGEGNPANGGTMSPAAYRGAMKKLAEEEEREEARSMTPQQRREARAQRPDDVSENERERRRAEREKREKQAQSSAKRVREAPSAEKAKENRQKLLDAFNDYIEETVADLGGMDYDETDVNPDADDIWDTVSRILGVEDISPKSLGEAIDELSLFVDTNEPGENAYEKRSVARAKALLKKLSKMQAEYADDKWFNQREGGPQRAGLASRNSNITPKGARPRPGDREMPQSSGPRKNEMTKLSELVKEVVAELEAKRNAPRRSRTGLASTTAGKTMITDEATFFKDVEASLPKEIRAAEKARNLVAVAGLKKLQEIIKKNEASKTGSRRTNAGSIFMTMDDVDAILEGLMFALDQQMDKGGEKRMGWYSRLIEKISEAAMSTFIDKTTSEIGSRKRTVTNQRGQKREINIVPEP